MDGETPSWLTEQSPSPAAAPAPAAPPSASTPSPEPTTFSLDEPAPPSSKTSPRTGTTDNVAGSILNSVTKRNEARTQVEVDESDLPKMILFMRILNLAAAALLVAASIVNLIDIPHISVWVMSIYAAFGGILVCCMETQLKFVRTSIAMNFGFLFHSIYRFIFYCLMASVSWSYKGLLGKITAITLGVVAVFNTYVLCRYPTYRRMREKIAEEEDKRIEAKINQQVRKQAMASMFSGGS